MAYDNELAIRIRKAMEPFHPNIEEKKMFGGLSFLYKGKMTVGIIKDDLVARVIMEKHPNVMQNKYTREMTFTGKAMKDFVYVDPKGIQTEEALREWINLGVEHAESKL